MKLWLVQTFYQTWIVRAPDKASIRAIVDPLGRLNNMKDADFTYTELVVDGPNEVLFKQ